MSQKCSKIIFIINSMNDRFTITVKNSEQCRYSLKHYIMTEDLQSSMGLTLNMFMNGLSKDIYETCIDIYVYNCGIYIPNYIRLILDYEQSIHYYYKLVLHLVFAPKQNIFIHFPDHGDLYFYLKSDSTMDNKKPVDNKKEMEKEFDKYYKTITYYMKNINLDHQPSIYADFSNLLYFLYFHDNYNEYSKNIWYAQFELFKKEEDLLEYARMFNVLEDFVESKKLKIFMLYYTLHLRFLDIKSVEHIYENNAKKIEEILNKPILNEKYC